MNSGMNAQTRQSDDWQTPGWLYDALDHEFGFNLDAAASAQNAKCAHYFSLGGENALTTEWQQGTRAVRAFCNPPYSQVNEFVRKAIASNVELVVMLLPVRTDSDWHRLTVERRIERRYFRKRISFLENGVEQTSPRFGSLIAVIYGDGVPWAKV